MSLHNLLNQFLGGQDESQANDDSPAANLKKIAGSVTEKIGGLGLGSSVAMGGAGLLMGSKKARSYAGTAAKVGVRL